MGTHDGLTVGAVDGDPDGFESKQMEKKLLAHGEYCVDTYDTTAYCLRILTLTLTNQIK